MNGDIAAVEVDELFGDGKPKAETFVGAFVRAVDLFKRSEDTGLIFFFDTDAGIFDGYSEGIALCVRGECDVSARSELDRVVDEVMKDLLEPVRISLDKRCFGRNLVVESDLLFVGRLLREGDHGLDRMGKIDGGGLEGQVVLFEAGEIEEIVDKCGKASAALCEQMKIFLGIGRKGICVIFEQGFGQADHAVEGCA